MKQHTLASSLQQQLDALNAQTARVRPDVAANIRGNIEELARAGIAQQSLKKGALAPDFALPDTLGETVSLSELLQTGPVVVTFYRGQWCPYCNLQLRAYQQIIPQLKAMRATLVAISPQKPDHSMSMVEKAELTFPVLSDVDSSVARQYKIIYSLLDAVRSQHLDLDIDLSVFNGTDAWELPLPGTFLIDQTGLIRFVFVDPDYTRRLEPAVLLAELSALVEEK